MARRVLVVSTLEFDDHDTGIRHPERAERLAAAMGGVHDAGLGDALREIVPRAALPAELERVHDARYLRAVEELATAGGGHLDPDTVVSPGSWSTATLAAGSGLAVLDALRAGAADAGLVLVRPPGHHATRARGQGFCLINNIAVAAATLVDDGERVLIVDWDVHHGNGTQDIFWNDPRVMYVSTHQSPAYPGTGSTMETGGPDAVGHTINFPLPPGATGDIAREALDEVVTPAVERFSPTWVLVSAGYDAHRADPLADLEWSAGDYVGLTQRVAAFTPQPGRLVAFLEGGYDLNALRECVRATVATLAGGTTDTEAPTAGGPGRDVVAETARIHSTLIRTGELGKVRRTGPS
jgi:acetoin utilization deacetylase AcuC-like enzyme